MSKDELATAGKKENDHPSNTAEVEMHPQSAQEKTGERSRRGAKDGVHHVEQCMEICGTDDDDDFSKLNTAYLQCLTQQYHVV